MGISLTQLVNVIIEVKKYTDNKINNISINSQEEIKLIKEQNELLKQQISQLETIIDSINNEVI
jgi:hypothetical protein